MVGTRGSIVLGASVGGPGIVVSKSVIINIIPIIIEIIGFLATTSLSGGVFVFVCRFSAPIIWVGHGSIVDFFNIAAATPAIRGVGRGGRCCATRVNTYRVVNRA